MSIKSMLYAGSFEIGKVIHCGHFPLSCQSKPNKYYTLFQFDVSVTPKEYNSVSEKWGKPSAWIELVLFNHMFNVSIKI